MKRRAVDDFEELYAVQVGPVWRFVHARVPGREDAEDVTSEVFARALRTWRTYDARRGPAAGWLLGIARHAVADWWRRHRRDVSLERVAGVLVSDAPAPEADAVAAVTLNELRRHLGELSDRERDALALRFGVGLRAAEVGAALGVSETAARMLVYRAVSKLRAVMAGD
jgi:RNA polymerase sigma factor (sigma-70 family)